jgi:putative heme utilization carrier protein HutX
LGPIFGALTRTERDDETGGSKDPPVADLSTRPRLAADRILFIVHTPDIVLECAGPLPPGTFGRGYYNVHGDGPIGGHIRAENCAAIAFVSRPFMGRASRSIQFFNGAGEAMFKIFVRRDEARELIPAQVAKLDALRERCRGMARGQN